MLAGQTGAERRQESRDQARVVEGRDKRGRDGDYDSGSVRCGRNGPLVTQREGGSKKAT
jgi:hypothetical protein